MDSSTDYVFNILYVLLTLGLIYPTNEFVSVGLTIPSLFHSYLGNEYESFTRYNLRKSCLTLFVYSILPLGYVILSSIFGSTGDIVTLLFEPTVFWRIFITSSLVLPLMCLYQILNWTRNDYENHPIARNLAKFANNNSSWNNVANDIDNEFRRVDKIMIQTSSIIKVIATENWIIKVMPLKFNAIHQSDASLVVKESETYQISPQLIESQYLNIEVKSDRPGVSPFVIRINALEFKDLKDRIARMITFMPNVKFHRNIIDQFTEVFEETIKENPSYKINQDLDQCIGCLQARSCIKLQKLCEDIPAQENCTSCYCRPMWCTSCMAKWFASRQDQDMQLTWLSSKCTCPMCRATFCLLDVCIVEENNPE